MMIQYDRNNKPRKKRMALNWQIFIGMLMGLLYGIFFPDYLVYVSWMGDLYIRILKMLIIPLVSTTIITSMANIGHIENFNRIGLKTLIYYFMTSVFAMIIGLLLVNLIKPGIGVDISMAQPIQNLKITKESYLNFLKIIPNNIFEALSSGSLLPIILFSILFGYFITKIQDKQRKFLTEFFSSTSEVSLKLIKFIIKLLPYGIMGIIAKIGAEQFSDFSKFIDTFKKLDKYLITILLGIALQGLVILPLILKYIGKINPWQHFRAMKSVLFSGFTVSSCEVVLPITMYKIKNKTTISNRVSSIVLPFGSSLNFNGTLLYECIAALFIAQAYGVEITLYEQALVMVTAMLASVGTTGVPMSSIIMISVILSAIGVPQEGLGIIIIIDRLIDMLKALLNVWSDTCGAVIIAKTEGENLVY